MLALASAYLSRKFLCSGHEAWYLAPTTATSGCIVQDGHILFTAMSHFLTNSRVSCAQLSNVVPQEELMAFMRAVNPCVDWTETQWRLIVDEAGLQPSTCYMLQNNVPLIGSSMICSGSVL